MSNRLNRISNLPDGVIHHIFSFIPTQYMVRSTVLSKRWRNLWCSAPTLYFDRDDFLVSDDAFDEEQVDNLFYKFVDFVLLFRERSNMQKLYISWSWQNNMFDPSRIYAWLFFAIKHGIQILSLDLDIPSGSTLEFGRVIPSSLFMCGSLTRLKLHMDEELDGCLIIPSSTSLSCLKSLDLQNITFRDKKSADAFFSSCSVLENLVLKNCIVGSSASITINSLQLKSLSVYSGIKGIKLEVSAPSLEHFNLDVEFPYERLLLDCPSLINAWFHVHEQDEPKLHPLDLVRTLKAVHNAQIIELSGYCLQVILEEIDLLREFPIPFSELKCMKLSGTNPTIPLMMILLETSPKIESLILKFDEGKSSEQKFAKMKELGCFSELNHLKSIDIHGFNGDEDQQKVLRTLWEKAVVLENITINFKECQTRLEQTRLTKLGEKLFRFPKAYPNVRIVFHSIVVSLEPFFNN